MPIIVPKDIPASFRELMPEIFLPTTTPKHIQEAFYSRTLKSKDVFELEDYKKYLAEAEENLGIAVGNISQLG